MNHRIIGKLIGCILLVCHPLVALAWGPQGHRLVGYIAEQHLTEKARVGVQTLLGTEAHLSDQDVAVWADIIRNDRKETAPWHYADIPIESGRYDPARDCRNGDCVIAAVEKFSAIVADKKTSREKRVEALKYLVHFVGDMHQPLHCAERNHDHGGGRFDVVYEGKATNLHRIWDDQIVYKLMRDARDITGCGRKLDQAMSADCAAAWQSGSIVDWAMESNHLAATDVYAGLPAKGPPPVIEAAYIERNIPVVRQRLQQAGVRLAMLLNKALQ